ncbi:MAG: glycosyltransferase, partial [candidate division Zixibacteria bacterium]|nr:glycosyltransferase [candidate division Zixibacteria bacterium]
CGTPVVATNVGCVETVIRNGETGYVVMDNAPRRLARKIGQLLSRPNGRLEAPQSIRASVSGFRW